MACPSVGDDPVTSYDSTSLWMVRKNPMANDDVHRGNYSDDELYAHCSGTQYLRMVGRWAGAAHAALNTTCSSMRTISQTLHQVSPYLRMLRLAFLLVCTHGVNKCDVLRHNGRGHHMCGFLPPAGTWGTCLEMNEDVIPCG